MYENDITDVAKSDAAVETSNTPDGGADATTIELVEHESKQTTKEQERPSSPQVGGDLSVTTLEKDSPSDVTSKSLETDSITKEEPTEDTTVPATVIEIKEPPSEETSNVAENGEEIHTPTETTEESTSSALSQPDNINLTSTLAETQESITQELNVHEAPAEVANEDNLVLNEGTESNLLSHQVDTSITSTSAETAETQEIQPQEVSIHEVAAEVVTEDKLLPNEEGAATYANMEPDGSSLSHQEDDNTLTTPATEIQKSPPQEDSTYESVPEVATKEGTANLTNVDTEGSLLSQQEEDTTLPTTAADTQENPHPVELKYENEVKVEKEEGTANLTNMEAGGNPLSQQEGDTTFTTTAAETHEIPPQEESTYENDGENIASAGEAGGTPEVGHVYVEGSVGDNRRGSGQQKKKRRRRNLKIAIGFVVVIIIGLGIGIGLLVASKDDDDTSTTTTTMSTTTIATTVEETTTTMATTETERTTTQIITTPTTVSPSFISKHEMRNFTSGFIDLDENNKGGQVKVEHGNKTQEGIDQTYEPLLEFKKNALKGPTLETFVALLNNYTPDVDIEDIPSEELVKEFLDAVMKTSIMEATEEFMRSKTFDGSLRDYLQQIWFTPYSRSSNGVFGSSGFEHTFVGEQKDGHVRGFQNWVNFGLQEQKGILKYKGWKKSIALKTRKVIPPLKNKGEILELSFEWQNNTRSLDYMFIGTSPELELALYTLCYWAKLGEKCHVQLNNHRFVIHTSDYGGLGVVGSAYPDVSNTVI